MTPTETIIDSLLDDNFRKHAVSRGLLKEKSRKGGKKNNRPLFFKYQLRLSCLADGFYFHERVISRVSSNDELHHDKYTFLRERYTISRSLNTSLHVRDSDIFNFFFGEYLAISENIFAEKIRNGRIPNF